MSGEHVRQKREAEKSNQATNASWMHQLHFATSFDECTDNSRNTEWLESSKCVEPICLAHHVSAIMYPALVELGYPL